MRGVARPREARLASAAFGAWPPETLTRGVAQDPAWKRGRAFFWVRLSVAPRSWHCAFSLRFHLMENHAATAPAEGFFPSFLLLAGGTLLAALLGAAHRLGLFYQLMHKVPGHRREAAWGHPRKVGP